MMDVGNAASKGHGFFSLFDWGKSNKSRKRLCIGSSTESPTPRHAGDEKEVDGGTTPITPSDSIIEDAPSLKESSEHSFSSSVADEEAQARRGPTVIARLMGLDSMPAASASSPYSMPLTVQEPLQNNGHDEMTGTSYVGSSSPHKMAGSPIDRFRMEAPPPRFGKRTLPVAQSRLFSPVKNHNHMSSRNAADIMETASRIIGPRVENTSSYRGRDVGYANVARAFTPTKIVRVQQRSPTPNEAPTKRDGSASSRQLSGKPSDSIASCKTSQSSNGAAPVGHKVKSRSTPSPDARATNAQGSEGPSKSSSKLATCRGPGNNLAERNGPNRQKSKNQIAVASSSSVLVENSRKHNDMCAKNKVDSKPARIGQQQSNMHSTNASPRKVGATSAHAENRTQGNGKSELQRINRGNRRLNSAEKTIPKPRRLPDGRMCSNKSWSSDKFVADLLEDTTSACETSTIASTDYDRDSLQSFKDGQAKFPRTDLASKSNQSYQSTKYDNDAIDQAELEHLHPSSQSTWEASLSTETCSSVESWRSANETRLSRSTEGAATSASGHYSRSVEADALSDYSDTASSITVTTTAEIPRPKSSSSCCMDHGHEINFVREILNACSLGNRSCSLERLASSDILDPNLCEELNAKFSLAVGQEDGKSSRVIRRLLFDCVNETLSVKCARYFSAGYASWFMGEAVLQKLSPEQIYQEMNSPKVAEEFMVDELVYREMCAPLGSWVDFKTESYETGKDITSELLGFFLDETVADLLTDALS